MNEDVDAFFIPARPAVERFAANTGFKLALSEARQLTAACGRNFETTRERLV